VSRASRAWLTARPTVPRLEDQMVSTLSVLMVDVLVVRKNALRVTTAPS
jgi:hypothetical protein